MIVKVDEDTINSAAVIFSRSWKESHTNFCSKEFVKRHTVENQKNVLRKEILEGKDIYILFNEMPIGIVSVKNSLIENLYILPQEQHKGYGTELLGFAMKKCNDIPRLRVRDNNINAYTFYLKHGFVCTGNKNKLSENISEVEMILNKK